MTEREECGWTLFSLLQMVVLKCWFVLFCFVFMAWAYERTTEDEMNIYRNKLRFGAVYS